MKSLRILSLIPAATDIVYLLGLEKSLVGTEKDVSSGEISNEMESREIDRSVKDSIHKGIGIFHIDQEKLEKLNPNLILTQELCKVCAIPFTQVKNAARILDFKAKIISLEPESVEDVLENIRVVGEFGGVREKAGKMVHSLRKRLRKIATLASLARNDGGKRVLVVEWMDPMIISGNWVPEMVERAGGKFVRKNPDILIIGPCGLDIKRTLKEKKLIKKIGSKYKNAKIYLVDGDLYLTRPGPKVIDGIEILFSIINEKTNSNFNSSDFIFLPSS